MAPSHYSQYQQNNSAQYNQDPNASQNYQQQGYWYGSTNQSINQSTTTQPNTASARAEYGYANNRDTSYRDRSHYDTSAVGSLPSINLALNGELARPPTSTQAAAQTYSGYAEHAVQSEPQHSEVARHQSNYVAPTHNHAHSVYAPAQARTDSVDYANSTAYTASQTTQSTQYQTLRTANNYRATNSASPAQWAPVNQRNQASHSTTSTTRPSEYIARAATTVDQTNRSSAPQQATSSTTTQTAYAPVTVNPTQVYDPWREQQRERQRQLSEMEALQKKRAEEEAVEAETKKRVEEVEAAAAAKREAEARAIEAERQAREQATIATEAPPKKSRKRKSEGAKVDGPKPPRKSRKSAPAAPIHIDVDVDKPAQEAAMTLLATANASNGQGGGATGSLETEMKELFRKMRQYNAADPELLARLWQQECDEYLADSTKEKPPAKPAPVTTTPTTKAKTATTALSEPAAKSSGRKAHKAKVASAAPPVTDSSVSALASTSSLPPVPNSTSPSTALVPPSMVPLPVISQLPSVAAAAARSAGTTWPADKKQTLAAAASKLLQAMPVNAGKTISPAKLCAILDTNPSYIELCKTIEALGFVIDRGYFARALLQAVPDVNKAAQKPITVPAVSAPTAILTTANGTPIPRAASNSLTASVDESAHAGLSNAATRLVNGGSVVEVPDTPKKAPKPRAPRPRKDRDSGTPHKSSNSVVVDPQLEGLDAVKHFVDGHGEEQPTTTSTTAKPKAVRSKPPRPSLPPVPATKEDLARKRDFGDLVDLTVLESDDEPVIAPYAKLESVITPPQTDTEQFPLQAAATSHYPGEQPPVTASVPPTQNVPGRPSQIPTYPTFATGPVQAEASAPIAATIPRNHPYRTIEMTQALDKYKAIRRSGYNPRTIARDVLLACGRHPDMRHLNAHYEVLKTAFPAIENTSDLGTFRWDIADPGGPPPGSGTDSIHTFEDIGADADDEDDTDIDEPVAVRATVGFGGVPDVELGRSTRISSIKKMTPKTRSHAGGDPTSGRSVDSGESPAQGYRALHALQGTDENGNPVKRKGRPVGWRKWMQKGGGSMPTPAPSSAALRPVGRPPKSANKPPVLEPVYQVYKCEWKDCDAELHNLATLRKHIHKVHGRTAENGLYACQWNDCGKVRSVIDGGRTVSRFVPEEYENLEHWKDHVEKKHIQPIAWELGDGPVGGLSERENSDLSDAYMSDSRGRRITPTITLSNLSSSSARPMTTAEKEARELQRLAEKLKREMGPGIDKGGARLANDKRRHGFVDDDEMDEVVEPDD